MADLLTMLHDIDRMRGRICGNCMHWRRPRGWLERLDACAKGYRPLNARDGCEDWQPRTHKQVAA